MPDDPGHHDAASAAATGRTPRGAAAGYLPAEGSSFIGRHHEAVEVQRMLDAYRLVTLVGIGGVGKTRLARHVAALMQPACRDGVWFVDLAGLRDPAMVTTEVHDPEIVARQVAEVLRVPTQPSQPASQVVARRLRGKRLLLVLDNCEYALPACTSLVMPLLRACPGLRVLGTSREPIRAYGEALFAVPPLSTPDPARSGPQDLGRYDAVALFTARAREAAPGFRLTTANQDTVVAICRQLDGLALAIELAAAALRVLDPEQLLARLSDRFAALAPPPAAAGLQRPAGPAVREQTLRACVDWSYELCAKPERTLWARLSVFAGPFALDAVEGVCADETLPAGDLMELVTNLVDKSVLIADDSGRHVRYRMLETIRDYGREKLIAAGDWALLRNRHRDWYAALVVRAREAWVSDQQEYWLDRLARDHPDLTVALDLAVSQADAADGALRSLVSLPGFYWWTRGSFAEGRRWLDRALAHVTPDCPLHARALLLGGYLAFAQGDDAGGGTSLEQGEALAGRLGAGPELAYAEFIHGLRLLYAGDAGAAVEVLQRASSRLVGAGPADLDLQLHLALAISLSAGLNGKMDLARSCVDEVLADTAMRGETYHRSVAIWTSALLAWVRGDVEAATGSAVDSLRLKRGWGQGDSFGTAFCLELLAWVAATGGRYERAALLLGAAGVLWTEFGTPAIHHLVAYRRACEQRVCEALGAVEYAETCRAGAALPYDDAVAYALDEPPQREPKRALSGIQTS